MTSPAAPHPFTIANYRFYWASRLSSMLASYGMVLIIGWQAYNLARGDGLSVQAASVRLGYIGLFQFVPLFILTPISGWVADHLDRRVIVRTVLGVQCLVALFLAVTTSRGAISLEFIYAIAVLLGICRAFQGPANGALAPNLVPKASLPTAIALGTIAWQTGVLIGPAIAGPLYAIEADLPYWIATGLFGLAFGLFFLVGPVPRSAVRRDHGPIGQILEGLRYVRSQKLLFAVISLDLFAVLLAGAVALIPVFARDILDLGATAEMLPWLDAVFALDTPEHALSLLAASPAMGAGLVALIFSFRPIQHNVGNKMLGSVFVFGLATIGFGLSKFLPLSMLCLFVYGAADMFSVYVRQSLIQLNTPDDRRGRVGAVSQLTISASNELGEAESGFLAGLIGPVAAVVAGGIGAIVITAIWMRLFPQIGAARTFEPSEEVAAEDYGHRHATEPDRTTPKAEEQAS